jgi:adenosylcobinamide-GDP ribazoletransferase
LLAAAMLTGLLAAWFRRRLGGWTGDTLGAVQQAAELAILLAAAWHAA